MEEKKKSNKKSNSEKIENKVKKEEKELKKDIKKVKKEVSEAKEKRVKDKTIKEARREMHYASNNEDDEFKKLIRIILIVTAVMIVFYGITVLVTQKSNKSSANKNENTVKIQYDNIVIGSMLNIDGNFYVLIEDAKDSHLNEYNTLLQSIKANDDAPKVYIADLSDSFNKKYLSDESDYTSEISNFKVKGTTLVKIEDHKIVDTYDDYDAIYSKLSDLE